MATKTKATKTKATKTREDVKAIKSKIAFIDGKIKVMDRMLMERTESLDKIDDLLKAMDDVASVIKDSRREFRLVPAIAEFAEDFFKRLSAEIASGESDYKQVNRLINADEKALSRLHDQRKALEMQLGGRCPTCNKFRS